MTGLAADRDRTPEAERHRLSLLVRLAASGGHFSRKLADAVEHTTDAEVRVMSDLVDRGMSVPALVSLLQGAHVVIGDDELYEAWIFPSSRRRMSSHHRGVDKRTTPDYGLDGPLVRESLHGKAAVGTWVQLERTKATFQWGKLPSWHDLVHIRDFVIYRITGKNVGPWGLSALVDTRPMVLRPPHSTTGFGARRGLDLLAGRDQPDAETSRGWAGLLTPYVPAVGPLGDLYAVSLPPRARDMLPGQPYSEELGPGLFGSLPLVHARVTLPERLRAVVDRPHPPALLEPEPGEAAETVTLTVRGVAVDTRAIAQRTGRREDPPGPDHHNEESSPMTSDPHASASSHASSVDAVAVGVQAAERLEQELADIAELVQTGPVDLGAYTQAEMAVVLGGAPALAGSSDEVLAEAVRSLAARGVLFRSETADEVSIVGDLGLVLALIPARMGTLEIRRGHAGEPDQPWRWLITVLPQGVVAVDRIDPLGLHRLALMSVRGVADTVVERLLAGPASIPKSDPGPVSAAAEDVRRVAAESSLRWQLIYRVPRSAGVVVAVEAHVLRTGPQSVFLVTRQPDGEEFTRAAVDAATLRAFLVDMVRQRADPSP